MSMTQETAAYFEKIAPEWDTIRAGYFTEAVRRAAIAKAYLRPEMTVADIGGGTGFMTAGLAPLVKRVYLVDGSQAMLAQAQRNLAQFQNVVYRQADGLNLPFEDQMFDAVFANMYLHHCPDPLAAIRELARILRPGGRLALTDLDAHAHTWMKTEMADVWLGFERGQIREWFEQAGLVNVIVDCTGESCCAEPQTSCCAEPQTSCCAEPQTSCCAEPQTSCCGSQAGRAQISVFVAVGTPRLEGVIESVQAEYAAHARGGTGCCCSTSDAHTQNTCCCSTSETQTQNTCCCSGNDSAEENALGYRLAELGEIPGEAAEISLGCGNPLALAALQPGEVVLDIGSGGGIDAFLAARRVGAGGRVIGVDMTPAMLERARQAAEKGGYTQVEFRQGRAEMLPVEDSTVDVVISNCVINLSEDKGRVFREAYRTLRPGGRLEVSDVVSGGAIPLDLRENMALWADCVSGALPEQEYIDLVLQAGFEQIQVHRKPVSGMLGDVPVYSVILSARKPEK